MKKSKIIMYVVAAVVVIAVVATCGVLSANGAEIANSFWALVPPIIAIALALITKEVYSSLFIGIVVGGIFASKFDVLTTISNVTNEGFISAVSGTAGIFVFLVLLGVLVALVNKAGGSAAFGRWLRKTSNHVQALCLQHSFLVFSSLLMTTLTA